MIKTPKEMDTELKLCSKCNTYKVLVSFYKDSKSLDGLRSSCKECSKEYYENNKDKIKEHHKEYYKNNKDKIKEHHKEYRENNKDKIKDKKKEYRENNKDKIKEYYKEYRKENHFKDVLWKIKRRHKEKGYKEKLDITEEYLRSIYTEHCPISGIKFEVGDDDGRWNSPSLDRMDNNKGYIKGNVMYIANIVNTSKSNLSYRKWKEYLASIRDAIKNEIWLNLKPRFLDCATYIQPSQKVNLKKYLISQKKNNNKKTYNYEFTITYNDVVLTDTCPITKEEFILPGNGLRKNNSISVDRIDNSKGYIKDNVWFISNIANIVKSSFTKEQILGETFDTIFNNVDKFIEMEESFIPLNLQIGN